MDLININIDCYNCGEKIFIPFRLNIYQAEYSYCAYCRSSIEVLFNSETKELNINYLPSE